MAFVSQEDVMYVELSVLGNVLYSALLFNRRVCVCVCVCVWSVGDDMGDGKGRKSLM